VGRRNIFKQQLGMRVYIRIIITMVLEQYTLPHQKI